MNHDGIWRGGGVVVMVGRHFRDTPLIQNRGLNNHQYDNITTRYSSIASVTRLLDRICGAAVRLIGHLWIAMQSFHQGYALINQYFGGLKGLRIRTPGRGQSYRIGGGSGGLLLGAHIRMWLSHGALLGELMRIRLRSEYNFKGGILEG